MRGTFIDEIFFLAIIAAIADIQARRFNSNIPINKWYHTLWSIPTAVYIVFFWWFDDQNYYEAAALLCEHFVVFSPLLNKLRKPKKAYFYIHDDKNGSWFDGQLLKIEKYYPVIYGIVAVALVYLQTKI